MHLMSDCVQLQLYFNIRLISFCRHTVTRFDQGESWVRGCIAFISSMNKRGDVGLISSVAVV